MKKRVFREKSEFNKKFHVSPTHYIFYNMLGTKYEFIGGWEALKFRKIHKVEKNRTC